MEAEIKESLQALLAAIHKSDRQTVAAEMARLESLLGSGGTALHPQLVHFLERRSYAKALQFLGGDTEIPAGNCGGRK